MNEPMAKILAFSILRPARTQRGMLATADSR